MFFSFFSLRKLHKQLKKTRQKPALHLAMGLRSLIVGKMVQVTFLQVPSLSIVLENKINVSLDYLLHWQQGVLCNQVKGNVCILLLNHVNFKISSLKDDCHLQSHLCILTSTRAAPLSENSYIFLFYISKYKRKTLYKRGELYEITK